jgi:Fe2+ transport system protein FeoA
MALTGSLRQRLFAHRLKAYYKGSPVLNHNSQYSSPKSPLNLAKSFLQLSLNRGSFLEVKKVAKSDVVREGACAQPGVCPLSRVRSGTVVCIKQLAASSDVMSRLREMGFCEEQRIKLISREGNLICQVGNARLGISAELAETILVQPVTGQLAVA